MSVVSVILNEMSKEVLSGVGGVVKDALGTAKDKLAAKLPTASELADSIRRQAQFKQLYRQLPGVQQTGVDKALEVICGAALVKVKKGLGL